MRALLAFLVLAASFIAPAHAQDFDPANPDHQFRALAAITGGGKRCKAADAIDGDGAKLIADQMMGDKNEPARKLFNEIYNLARTVDCANPQLVELFKIGLPLAQAVADPLTLAYLDQGFCGASSELSAMRLYAVYRQSNMSAERKAAAAKEEVRAPWRDGLKESCTKINRLDMDWFYVYNTSVIVGQFMPAIDTSCLSDWAKDLPPFDCVYGKRPQGPAAYTDKMKFGRQSLRASLAKALALEVDTAGGCGVFSSAERAAGEAQMMADARFGLTTFNATTKSLSAKLDPDKAYKTPTEIAAAGKALAKTAACADLTAAIPVLADDAPDTQKGEQVIAAAGAQRIRETMDRTAMVAAALPTCPALPNFAATKTAAEAYIAGITPERRLVAAAESTGFIAEIDRRKCDPAKMDPAFKKTALFAVDALNGAWK